jgi:hypothetical protein
MQEIRLLSCFNAYSSSLLIVYLKHYFVLFYTVVFTIRRVEFEYEYEDV